MRKRGRPATRTQDWETTHKRIRLLNITFERWRALKDELKLPNDDSIVSFLLSLYTELKSGNNNSGQRDEPIRRECDLSASIPLMEEEAGSPSCYYSPLRDELFGRDVGSLCEDVSATVQGNLTRQHNNMRTTQ